MAQEDQIRSANSNDLETGNRFPTNTARHHLPRLPATEQSSLRTFILLSPMIPYICWWIASLLSA